jgi:hypothetical protein
LVRYFGAPEWSINRRGYREKGSSRRNLGANRSNSDRLHSLLSQLGAKDSTSRHPNAVGFVATNRFGIGNADSQT